MNAQNHVITEYNGEVLELKLNYPETYNSLTSSTLELLNEKLNEAEKNDAIKIIFLSGEGKAFCSGQNLKEVTGTNAQSVKNLLENYYIPLIKRMRELSKPIICGLNGLAAGAGVSLALACDVVLAKQSAKFKLGFSKIGLIPDAGGSFALLKALGQYRAMDLMLTDEIIEAEELKRLGIVSRVFEDDVFKEECAKYLQIVLGTSMEAADKGKQLINQALCGSLNSVLNMESVFQSELAESVFHQEKVRQFLAGSKK